LPKVKAELLASRLKQWNVLQSGVKWNKWNVLQSGVNSFLTRQQSDLVF